MEPTLAALFFECMLSHQFLWHGLNLYSLRSSYCKCNGKGAANVNQNRKSWRSRIFTFITGDLISIGLNKCGRSTVGGWDCVPHLSGDMSTVSNTCLTMSTIRDAIFCTHQVSAVKLQVQSTNLCGMVPTRDPPARLPPDFCKPALSKRNQHHCRL